VGAIGNGYLHGVRHQHLPRTEPREFRIESGEIGVVTPARCEAVPDGYSVAIVPHQVRAQESSGFESRGNIEMKLPDLRIGEHSGFVTFLPALAMEAEKFLQVLAVSVGARTGDFDGGVAGNFVDGPPQVLKPAM
jgi:hypothetical protein